MEIRSRDSYTIPLMIEENRAKFFTVSLLVPLEQCLPQGYKGLIFISLPAKFVYVMPEKFENGRITSFVILLTDTECYQQNL